MIASAVLVVMILIAGAIAFAARQTSDRPDTGVHMSAVPSSTTQVPTSGPAADGFAVPEVDLFGRRVDIPHNPDGQLRPQNAAQKRPGDRDWLTAPPAGLGEEGGWQRIHGAVVPVSTSDGPTRTSGGVLGGYARTPQGAALAAAMSVHQVAARPGDRAVVAQRLVLTADDRARFDTGIASGQFPAQQPERVTRTLVAFDAFRIEHFADDLTVVQLAARSADSATGRTWITAQIPMVWHDGDWRLRGTGRQYSTDLVSDLAGWTRWA